MGLKVGVAQLNRAGVPLLHQGSVQYQDILSYSNKDEDSTYRSDEPVVMYTLQTVPVAVIIDAMTMMFSITPRYPVYPPILETRQVLRKRLGIIEKTFATFAPSDLYETFAKQLLEIIVQYKTTHDLTLLVIFDKPSLVVSEKHQTQATRSIMTDDPPYLIPGMTSEQCTTYQGEHPGLSGVRFTDNGLVGLSEIPVNEDHDPDKEYKQETDGIYVRASRIMSTRALRPRWYQYILTKLIADFRFQDIHLLVDTEVGGPYEVVGGHATQCPGLDVNCGEGEVAAVAAGILFSPTHHVQVWSGDSDTIVLALIHAPRFKNSFVATLLGHIGKCHTLSPLEFRRTLAGCGWGVDVFCLGLILNGTDFVQKKNILHYINPVCIMYGTRVFCEKYDLQPKEICNNCDTFRSMLRSIISLHYHLKKIKRSSSTKHGLWSATILDIAIHAPVLSEGEMLSRRRSVGGHIEGLGDHNTVEQARQIVYFNWTYWESAQGFVDSFSKRQQHLPLDHLLDVTGWRSVL